MFKKGEIVVYSATGVCEIVEHCTKSFGSFSAEYYVLRPLLQKSSTVFVPTNNEALTRKIHPILIRSEFEKILSSATAVDGVLTENETERREKFGAILDSGDRAALISMVSELYNIKKRQMENGRRLHIADEKLLDCAENLLFEEIAYVLEMTKDQAEQLIKAKFQI